MEKKEEKQVYIEFRLFVTTIILLGVLIILAGASSYFIQAGNFVETALDGKTTEVYQAIAQTPVPLWKIVISPLLSLTGPNGPKIIVLVLFILIIGGSFAILNRSGVLPSILADLVKRFANRKQLFLIVNIIIFSLLGSCLGILEEIVPLILIFVPLSYRMGWDSITGIAIPFLSAGFGFAAATFNPFTIGTAQKLADVALFSGLALRVPFFILTTTTVIIYLLRYTSKIEKDPTSSVTYSMDQKMKQLVHYDDPADQQGVSKGAVIWMGFCFLLIVCVVLSGPVVKIVQDLAFPLIALIFLIMGLGVGLFAGRKIREVFSFFFHGIADFSPAILLVLMAAAVGYLIVEGNVMDTILYTVANLTQGLSKELAILLIYGFQLFMNFFVPSGTGQAVLTIPILAPLGDLLGITRQTVVLAFHFGDGFSNLIWPTNPMLLIAIGLAGVSYKDWFRWVLPIQVILALLGIAFLLLAVNINYV